MAFRSRTQPNEMRDNNAVCGASATGQPTCKIEVPMTLESQTLRGSSLYLPPLIVFIVLATVAGAILFRVWLAEERLLRDGLRTEREHALSQLEYAIIDQVKAISRKVRFVSQGDISHDALCRHPGEGLQPLQALMTDLARPADVYIAQLRYLDATGQERIRINRKARDVEIVEVEGIRSQRDREYFSNAMVLPVGGLYVANSTTDNHDRSPATIASPTLLISVPIAGCNDDKAGIIVGHADIQQWRHFIHRIQREHDLGLEIRNPQAGWRVTAAGISMTSNTDARQEHNSWSNSPDLASRRTISIADLISDNHLNPNGPPSSPIHLIATQSATQLTAQLEQIRQNLLLDYGILLLMFAGASIMALATQLLRARSESAREVRRLINSRLFELVPDGILVVNQRGVIQACNSRGAAIFGFRLDDMTGMPITRLVGGHAATDHDMLVAIFFSDKKSHLVGNGRPIKGRTADGKTVMVAVALSVPFDTGDSADAKMVIVTVRPAQLAAESRQASTSEIANAAVPATDEHDEAHKRPQEPDADKLGTESQ